jgi:hypothetical protein
MLRTQVFAYVKYPKDDEGLRYLLGLLWSSGVSFSNEVLQDFIMSRSWLIFFK